jgi:plasmid stabilization system protein ParE
MAERFILRPEAEQDVAEAFEWYEQQEPGLGEELLRCVDACILAIRRNPLANPIAEDSFRRALVRRFPYAIFYEHEKERITIYAVFHCAQDPEKWRARLSE